MFDLIYPENRARLIGGQDGELLPVIDETGMVVARASRKTCHSGSLLHPVVHLHVIDRYSRIYLQKRAATKDLLPNMWDTTVGGHVGFGEFILEALYRESYEETGLQDFNPIFLETHLYDNYSEREMAVIFAAVGHFDFNPDKDEVSEGRWWTIEEIDDSIGAQIFTPQFEEEYLRIRNKLLNLL